MKKILFVLSSMNIGGVEKSLLSLLTQIPKEKYEITVLLLEKKGGFLEYLPDWVKVEETKWFKDIKPIIMQSPQKTIKSFIKNKNYIKALRFGVIYFLSKKMENRYIYYKNILKEIPKCNTKYDIAVSYAGPTEIIDSYIAHKVKAEKKIAWVHFDVSKHEINERLYEKLYKRFDKVFVVSKEANKKLNKVIPSTVGKSEVFLNIVSKELIIEMANKSVDFDNEYKGIKIVTVGRLSKEKGQDLGIEALYKLRQDGYEVRWYCIGDGNARMEYEKLIKQYGLEKDFILLGATPNPYTYIKNCDIYVQTSRHEGYCLTLAEAKCLNKTIITTNFTGAGEQIIDGVNGFIVDQDKSDIYRKIKLLINNN